MWSISEQFVSWRSGAQIKFSKHPSHDTWDRLLQVQPLFILNHLGTCDQEKIFFKEIVVKSLDYLPKFQPKKSKKMYLEPLTRITQ